MIKFKYYKLRTKFDGDLEATSIQTEDIVFIEDTKELYTNGHFFGKEDYCIFDYDAITEQSGQKYEGTLSLNKNVFIKVTGSTGKTLLPVISTFNNTVKQATYYQGIIIDGQNNTLRLNVYTITVNNRGASMTAKLDELTINTSTYATKQELTEYAKKSELPEEYTLPIATSDTLGGIKVGAGLNINPQTGILSATGGGTADSVDWNNVTSKPENLVTNVIISGEGNVVTNAQFLEGTLTLTKSNSQEINVENSLESSSTGNALSAAMGKKLNDEKVAKTTTINGHALSNNVTITSTDIINENDPSREQTVTAALKSLSDNFSSYVPIFQIGQASGVAELDESRKVPFAQLPVGVTTNTIYSGESGKQNADNISKLTQRVGDNSVITDITFTQNSATNLVIDIKKVEAGINNSEPQAGQILINAASSSAAGVMSAEDKTKLDQLSSQLSFEYVD